MLNKNAYIKNLKRLSSEELFDYLSDIIGTETFVIAIEGNQKWTGRQDMRVAVDHCN